MQSFDYHFSNVAVGCPDAKEGICGGLKKMSGDCFKIFTHHFWSLIYWLFKIIKKNQNKTVKRIGPVVITTKSHSACVVVEKHGFGLAQRNYSWDKTNTAVGSEGIIFDLSLYLIHKGNPTTALRKRICLMFVKKKHLREEYNVLFSIWWSSTILILQTNPIFFGMKTAVRSH